MSRNDPDSTSTPREAGPTLVIVGASARACAESASRAGWTVHAADLFGDVDLRRSAASVVQVPCTQGNRPPSSTSGATGYPAGLPAAISGFPSGPCLYTGAVENHPDVIETIARSRPLAGNPADIVRAVRDPMRLASAVRAAGAGFPDTHAIATGLPIDGSFLAKPVASAGGRGICRWRGPDFRPAARPLRWQRFVRGESWSAAFVADGRTSRLLAASLQLVGRRWCTARPFAYCGSIDQPLDCLDDELRIKLDRLGVTLAAIFGLVGSFGIDFVLDEQRSLHVVEVNPRPTASMELHERATSESFVAAHLAACGFAAPQPARCLTQATAIWSKAIVFAGRGGIPFAPETARIEDLSAAWTVADGAAAVADIPSPATPLPVGGPLVTVFAVGDTAASSLAILRRRVAEMRRLFAAVPTTAAVSPRADAERSGRPRPRGNTA